MVGGGQHECGDDGAFAGGGCVEGEEAACTSVSNCSELGWGAGRGNPNVCGASNHLHDGVRVLEDATCFGGDDDDTDGYTHVAAVCVGGGARLCTVAELTAQETRGTGCGHDNQQVWSSDPCDGGFMSARGQRGQNPTCQTDLGTSLAVRCCTDAEVGSGDVACWAEAYEGPPPPPAEQSTEPATEPATEPSTESSECTGGVTLDNSPDAGECSGTAGDTCVYTCDAGYIVGASHVCGTDGAFAGGACEANQCTEGLTIVNSQTECAGATSEVCDFACDVGYTVGASHVCDTDGAFAGGACEANQCTEGLALEHSPTDCSGATGDECEYECTDGYQSDGAPHLCGTGGSFAGGSCVEINLCEDGEDNDCAGRVCTHLGPGEHSCYCDTGTSIPNSPTTCAGTPTTRVSTNAMRGIQWEHRTSATLTEATPEAAEANQCTEGLTIANSQTVCAGATSEVCDYACDNGFSTTSEHICRVDGAFTDGGCEASDCTGGLTLGNSPTECEGTIGDTCVYTCDEGYTDSGSIARLRHQCTEGLTIVNSTAVCSGVTATSAHSSATPGSDQTRQDTCVDPTACLGAAAARRSSTVAIFLSRMQSSTVKHSTKEPGSPWSASMDLNWRSGALWRWSAQRQASGGFLAVCCGPCAHSSLHRSRRR